MRLTAGTRIGQYDVVALIGAGGMGEVYRARDTRLDRDVAIKVLPESLAQASDRLARFEREAKTLAAVNHPNIATIHGFEESNGIHALVMELVDGATLADRISQGAISIDESLAIGTQIAEALEAAHENGVIHRDLKPANVKITPDGNVKVLDFGLAKAIDQSPASSAGASYSPTITTPVMLSGVGMILGTAAYMSPEQAKGRVADRRSDIWAFGCVLFEMLTGRRAFQGDDVSDVIAAVLRGEPDWGALPAELPSTIKRLLRRCLEKDRRRRLDSAADVRLEIEDAIQAPSFEPARVTEQHWTKSLFMSAALVASGALLATFVVWTVASRRSSPSNPATRLSVNVEPGVHLGEASRELLYQQRPGLRAFAISPDGRQIVYVGHDGKTSQLYVRRLNHDRATPIAGTAGAQSPFFSPDGQEVAFFTTSHDRTYPPRDAQGATIGADVDSRGAIHRVAVAGGPVRTIEISGDAPRVFPSATWSADDTLLLCGAGAIYRLPAAGGSITRLIEARPGTGLRFAELSPDRRAVLFNVLTPGGNLPDIALETLDTHERTVVVRGGSFPQFAASGHIVFLRSGKLVAVPFDQATRSARGDPVVVGEDIMQSEAGRAFFRQNGTAQVAMSRSGELAYVPGGVYLDTTDILLWVDRNGRAIPAPIAPAQIFGATISPDGKRVVWTQGLRGTYGIWLFDMERQLSRRISEGGYQNPIWSRDGTRLAAVTRGADGSSVLSVIDVDRGGASQQMPLDAGGYTASYWGPANTVFLQRITAGAPGRLSVLALDQTAPPKTLFEWSSPMYYPAFSRDATWMSYSVNETGAFEVYARSVSAGSRVERVSTNGGSSSAWSADGRELFYREGSRMMAVAISTDGGFHTIGKPRELFSGDYLEGAVPSRGFEVTPDGRRFLMKAPGPAVESTPVTSIQIVLNWYDELNRLAPSK